MADRNADSLRIGVKEPVAFLGSDRINPPPALLIPGRPAGRKFSDFIGLKVESKKRLSKEGRGIQKDYDRDDGQEKFHKITDRDAPKLLGIAPRISESEDAFFFQLLDLFIAQLDGFQNFPGSLSHCGGVGAQPEFMRPDPDWDPGEFGAAALR